MRSVEKAVPPRVQTGSRCLPIVPGSHDHNRLETFQGLPLPQAISDRGGRFECFEVGRGSEALPVLVRAVPHARVGDAGRSKLGS